MSFEHDAVVFSSYQRVLVPPVEQLYAGICSRLDYAVGIANRFLDTLKGIIVMLGVVKNVSPPFFRKPEGPVLEVD